MYRGRQYYYHGPQGGSPDGIPYLQSPYNRAPGGIPQFPYNRARGGTYQPQTPASPPYMQNYRQNSAPYVASRHTPLSSQSRFQNPSYSRPEVTLQQIENAVIKARDSFLNEGKSLSAWEVSQAALLSLRVDSWTSLGFQLQEIPTLHHIILTEGKVNAFIHCFVGVRRITTLYDLEVAICKSEGIGQFEELGLGPLLRHPLVGHYFFIPPDMASILPIKTEDVIISLAEYMEASNDSLVQLEAFLDVLSAKWSASAKEKLGVRLQNLGMHVTSIREATKSEKTALRKCIRTLKHTPGTGFKGSLQPRDILSEKEALSERFSAISERVRLFASATGKHTRFLSSDSEKESSDHANDIERDICSISEGVLPSSLPHNVKDVKHHVGSCPYPSATEEIKRLAIKTGIEGSTSSSSRSSSMSEDHDKKRKLFTEFVGGKSSDEETSKRRKMKKNDALARYCHKSAASVEDALDNIQETPSSRSFRLGNASISAKEKIARKKGNDRNSLKFSYIFEDAGHRLDLENGEVQKFIATWKEACKEQSATRVFYRMLQFYKPKMKLMRRTLQTYPVVGLLNVAVQSIKQGVWDSLYDSLQFIGEDDISNTNSVQGAGSPLSGMFPVGKQNHITCNQNFTVDDIVKRVISYFQVDHFASESDRAKLPSNSYFKLFASLHACEVWLAEQFSVNDFVSLGYGDFCHFLEEYMPTLPCDLGIAPDQYRSPSLEVSMVQNEMLILVSQASKIMGEDAVSNTESISLLLRKQFPLIGFEVKQGKKKPLDVIRMWQNNDQLCFIFSATLLGNAAVKDLSASHQTLPSNANKKLSVLDQGACYRGSFSSKDAITCLLKAPMLFDLLSWSHWDFVYAPSLGPLVEWLILQDGANDLSCLLTRDGRLIRVDSTVTADSFLEALLRGSSYQAAVHLLSLVCQYRGIDHVPSSLLKCYAARAFEVALSSTENKDGSGSEVQGSFDRAPKSSHLPVQFYENLDGATAICRLIVECIYYLPPEFRSFAADILLSGLKSHVKDGPVIILNKCNQVDKRVMLHEIGMSLGISEWIEDYHKFTSSLLENLAMFDFGENYGRSGSTLDIKCKGSLRVFDSASVLKDLNNMEVENPFAVQHRINGQSDVNDWEHKMKCSTSLNFEGSKSDKEEAAHVIDSIRKEEFGLDSNLEFAESSLLQKQHARLGRALHCLSQELYSQDSHFLLELVQNADDNRYPESIIPTLVFILMPDGIVVLNNEVGFSAKNIRAMCDIGNSTKKGTSGGYIGKKGIGFKSVFRVTDAPEIHSNGFHVKFDASVGQIGFVLPTVVPPVDVGSFLRHTCTEEELTEYGQWNTCVWLPFRSKLGGAAMQSAMSIFSDLHPSLLLFLHRLQCIKFKNVLEGSLTVMGREVTGDGLVKVYNGKGKMTWLVARRNLCSRVIRPDVEATEIAIAFTLDESGNGEYRPHLKSQPVFAFLPLRTYGLKFIIQGDFVLPSSREEVDGDNAWNQWLLSEFPALFVNAEKMFSSLPCFQKSPGKAITTFMSFVPLTGEVHGFFSQLPSLIISKLRASSCLLLEGSREWVPPCRVLRGWDHQVKALLPEELLHKHLGLGYLDKDVILSDSLARALGVKHYGPRILVEMISSICQVENGVKLMGLAWLSSWLDALWCALSMRQTSDHINESEIDLIDHLSKIPFVPLSDGSFASLAEGPIWLPTSAISKFEQQSFSYFRTLCAKLRTVHPSLLSETRTGTVDTSHVEVVTRMLGKIGVRSLSAHEIIRSHILGSLTANVDESLLIEYLCFIMVHFQSTCQHCETEKAEIISCLCEKPVILTQHGFKCPLEEPVHFGQEFGNPINIDKLFGDRKEDWHEIDTAYLNHSCNQALSFVLKKWRKFFEEFGVTDFVRVVSIKKSLSDILDSDSAHLTLSSKEIADVGIVEDWESPELAHILSFLSLDKCQESCKYLLEILDTKWDDAYIAKATIFITSRSNVEKNFSIASSFMKSIRNFKWIPSIMDVDLHYSKDLFFKCDTVHSILGDVAPYSSQMSSHAFVKAIGLKTEVTLSDALSVLKLWSTLKTPFLTSVSQMSRFYTFVWNEINNFDRKFLEFQSLLSIFLPFVSKFKREHVVPGRFLQPEQVYWCDATGCVDCIRELGCQPFINDTPSSRVLIHAYPSLHDFFVNICGVDENPSCCYYVQILLQLSCVARASQAANAFLQVVLKWADDLRSGSILPEEISNLKESLLKVENTVLPTVQNRWVSLHSKYGLICWCDDEELRKEFRHSTDVDFLCLGEQTNKGTNLVEIVDLMKTIGIPALSELVSREPIFYGVEENNQRTCQINWILPYAQRYLCKNYPAKYSTLRLILCERLRQLEVAVVEKLYYKYCLKGCQSTSKERFACKSLLQGHVLYVTSDADSHSVFMELSRLFFDGSPDVHLANFLDMIFLRAESGSSEEKMEQFILNSQKIPPFPNDEIVWAISCLPKAFEKETSFSVGAVLENMSKRKRKIGVSPSWPPTGWRTAPDSKSFLKPRTVVASSLCVNNVSGQSKGLVHTEEIKFPIDINDDQSPPSQTSVTLQNTEIVNDESTLAGCVSSVVGPASCMADDSDSKAAAELGPTIFTTRDQLLLGIPNENQMLKTGRLGEQIAYNYFAEKLGQQMVKWVNEETETGLPFDLVIGQDNECQEFIEVKATKSQSKDWFAISTREWQFATERGDSFSVAHVILNSGSAKLTVLKNPLKLCQQNLLQLVILMPKQQALDSDLLPRLYDLRKLE